MQALRPPAPMQALRPPAPMQALWPASTHLGFEVKVDVDLAGGGSLLVQFVPRRHAGELALEPGDHVRVARADSARAGAG